MPERVTGEGQYRRELPAGPARAPLELTGAQSVARALGNRAFARAARDPVQGRRLQRMLIPLGAQWAEQENARRLREVNPIEYRAGAIAELQRGEVLHLVAHAGPSEFGGYRPNRLFASLVRYGLTPDVGGIQLHGCQSTAYARTLENLVNTPAPAWQPQRRIKVIGVPGYHLVSSTGVSWSVGLEIPGGLGEKEKKKAQDELDRLWESVKPGVQGDPTDAKLRAAAAAARQYGRGEVFSLKSLTTRPDVLLATHAAVREQLEQRLKLLRDSVRRDASWQKDLESLAREVALFIRATGVTVTSRDKWLSMAQRAVARGLEVLDAVLASGNNHVQRALKGESREKLRRAQAKLREVSAGLPVLVPGSSAGPVAEATDVLKQLRYAIASAPGSSSTARQWSRSWHDRYGSAVELLVASEALAQPHLADTLKETLGAMRFPVLVGRSPPPPPTPLPTAPASTVALPPELEADPFADVVVDEFPEADIDALGGLSGGLTALAETFGADDDDDYY